MQKIFRKYAVIIITAAIVAILIVNYAMVSIGARKQQVTTFQSKIDQIIHTIQSNQVELQSIRENLDEDYLTRARAAAYVIDLQPEMLDDVEELQNLVSLLNVDEIHVIDENGIIQDVKHYHLHLVPIYKSDKDDKDDFDVVLKNITK